MPGFRDLRYVLVPFACDHLDPQAPDHLSLSYTEWSTVVNLSSANGYQFFVSDDGFDGYAVAAMRTALKKAMGIVLPPKRPEPQPANDPAYVGPSQFVTGRAAAPSAPKPLDAVEAAVATRMVEYLETLGRRGFGVVPSPPR